MVRGMVGKGVGVRRVGGRAEGRVSFCRLVMMGLRGAMVESSLMLVGGEVVEVRLSVCDLDDGVESG